MKVTVCIPLYNGKEYLKECLQSVINQQYTDWKAIVGVNGHGETGGQVFQDANKIQQELGDPRIRIVNLPTVNGISEADNALMDLADTEWVAHLDADDLWHPRKLFLQVNNLNILLSQGHRVDCIATGCTYFGTFTHSPSLPAGFLSENEFKHHNPIIHSSILVKRAEIRYIKDLTHNVQDYAAFCTMLARGSMFYTLPESLVLHRIHPQSAFNASGIQKPSIVKQRMFGPSQEESTPATVVTAFYEMPSKFPKTTYHAWIENFFLNVPCHLVIFTEQQNADYFLRLRAQFLDRTRIVILPREQWVANTKWTPALWEAQHKQDPEKDSHSPDLYKIWYEKKEFVKKAIQMNPFNHNSFVWCDAGIVRSKETLGWMPDFAREDRIPKDSLLLLQITPFEAADKVKQADGIIGDFLHKIRIGGGVQAGTKESWLLWSDQYDAMMERYLKAGRFVGKDQSIMASLLLEQPNLVTCIHPPPGRYRDPIQIWFFLLLWLGANSYRHSQFLT